MSAQGQGTTSTPPPEPKTGQDALSYLRTLQRWMKKTQALPGSGMTSTQTGSGRTFNVKASEQTIPPHPFQIVQKTGLNIDVLDGFAYVFDFLGDNGFSVGQNRHLLSAFNLTLTDDSINYIYIRVSFIKKRFTTGSAPDPETLNIWRVTSSSTSHIGIIATTTEQFDDVQYDGANGNAYFLIGTVDTADGEVVAGSIDQVLKENIPIMATTLTLLD